MLPRRQSIFHLGEEGGAAAVHHHRVGAAAMTVVNARRARERERERLVVGLQILVHHQHHHHVHHHHNHGRHGHGHAHAAGIVLKQVVRPRAAASSSRHGGHSVSCSFLKACSLCRRDLSPTKDVYMYRGDQGFCSEECRWQQILVDEGRDRQAAAAVGKERQRRGQAHHHSPHRTPNRGRPPPRKTLAVA